MGLSHKDWELPNSQIWLAKMDIDRGLDFPSRPAARPVCFVAKKLRTKMQNHWLFSTEIFFFSVSAKKLMRK